jgi:hypothetical protein
MDPPGEGQSRGEQKNALNTRVQHLDIIRGGILIPARAVTGERTRVIKGATARNRTLLLDELQRKSHGHVPANMAMGQPHAGVVGDEREHQPAGGGQERGIATGRVGEVEGRRRVEGAESFGEDPEVVAVEMDRVRERDGRLDDDVDHLLGGGELDEQGAGVCRQRVAFLDVEKRRVVVLGHEGVAIEIPLVQVVLVGLDDDGQRGGCNVCWAGVEGDLGDQVGESYVDALVRVGGAHGGWSGAGETLVVERGLDVSVLDGVGARFLVVDTEPECTRRLVGCDDNIITLTWNMSADGS